MAENLGASQSIVERASNNGVIRQVILIPLSRVWLDALKNAALKGAQGIFKTLVENLENLRDPSRLASGQIREWPIPSRLSRILLEIIMILF